MAAHADILRLVGSLARQDARRRGTVRVPDRARGTTSLAGAEEPAAAHRGRRGRFSTVLDRFIRRL
ncbi:hypothetical protein A5N15_07260 [Rothia kristinae]|uniref:Uncharacterized protein n=1 Tax=Rothia kristinae TaxID=37923 RepID=A0A199NSI3_9MICC|nr:hypothetical protein AN277_0205965 [Rothia kristinae]OAX59399.1 hypothetical protein A5N15_07260 [Rothia kristinae]